MLAVVALSAVAVNAYSAYFTATWDRLAQFSRGSGDYSDGRVDRYLVAETIATAWPTGVTGVGIGGFATSFGEYDTKVGDYPHNIFLEIDSELGVIGLVPFVLMLVWGVRRLLAFIRRGDPNQLYINYTLVGMLVFELINSCISGDINGNRTLFACLGLIGGITAVRYGVGLPVDRVYLADATSHDSMFIPRLSESVKVAERAWG